MLVRALRYPAEVMLRPGWRRRGLWRLLRA